MESDQEAIARLKSGDLGGLEVLVRRYQLKAVCSAFLVTGDSALAEDVAQATFIRAAERIAQYDEQRPFEPWFLRSVVNAALKAAERQKRFQPLDAGEDVAALEWLRDPAPLPEEQAQTAETRQAVWQALERLPARQRAAIVLRYYLELDEAEISRRLESPLGTVKWLLHRARQRLRSSLGALTTANPPAGTTRRISERRQR